MKHIVSATVKAATGLWPQLLPALGISVHAGGDTVPARFVAAKTASALTIRAVAEPGCVTSAGPVTASTWWKRRLTSVLKRLP